VTYEPGKLSDFEVEVHEKCDLEVAEKRGINLSHEVFQVLVNALEFKFGKSRKDEAYEWRLRSACWVRKKSRGTGIKEKVFKSGHH